MRRAVVGLVLASLTLAGLVLAGPIAAADPSIVFEAPSVAVSFPESATWSETFSSNLPPSRVELLSRLERGVAWFVRDATFTKIGQAANGDGQYRVRLADQGTALPNSALRYHFRVTLAPGVVVDGPEGIVRFDDDRVDWQTLPILPGGVVRLHWHTGDKTFAGRALRIAEDAIASTSKLLGVTETEPIDFFVYGDGDLFRTALPGTKEFVAGRAIAEIRTLFAVIQPSEIGSDWVQIVVPHELTHFLFDTATGNPYHVPPHWLNEGLAVYVSEGFTAADRQRLANAIERGTLLPLQAIDDGFPQAREELFYLGYAEGTSAIDFLIRRFGEPKLVELIRSYAAGVTDDEAFKAATGLDMAGFAAAWLDDIGAGQPRSYGPGSPLPGPTPADWAVGASAPSAAGPRDDLLAGALGGIAIGVLIVALALLVVRRRRPPPSEPAP
jgi:hypothetical protein